ncbi:MAG: alpha-mannosidase, partial [Clostridiales bacterium]|nr:alpha-mannosidase [Clostridiales bacterium]
MQMHQLDARVKRILDELKGLRVRRSTAVGDIEIAPRGGAFAPFENGSLWAQEGGWWDFRFKATVPEGYLGRAVLTARTGREAGWEALNPQFVVWVDGRIEQAFDAKHTELTLQTQASPGQTFEFLLNGYTPAPTAEQFAPFLRLTIDDVNEPVSQLIYDLWSPLEAASLLPEGDRDRETVLETLARAIDLLDLRVPHSAAFDDAVAAARALLKRELYDRRDQLPALAQAWCVGHTHIDVAWLWDLYQTRHKAVRSFSTVLKLMELYPEYKFMSSQAALYDFVRQDQPELFGRIKKAVADGRWEVEGGMWVEADCNLASGESLVRQFLHGQAFFEREFGVLSRILWLPDVFGYSAALPQIMKKSGIDYFMTTKISWSEYNLTPYDTFTWKGIDGSEVLTHFSPSRDFRSDFMGLRHFTTYNTMLSPQQVAGGYKRFQQKELDDQFLVAYGYGDGGGGPTDWMIENARRMATPLPLTPSVRQAHARPFFEALEERVGSDPRLPKWSGELYLEYHRGTYTAVGKNKRNNRKFELKARDVELWLSYARRVAGLDYPIERLNAIWEQALTLQFHDILPGSSIKKVYDDSDRMYADLFGQLDELQRIAVRALAGRVSGDLKFFNSLSHVRDDVVYFDAPEGARSLRSADGTRRPIQRLSDGRCCAFVTGLLPMTATPYWFDDAAVDAPCVKASTEGFETPAFEGKFDGAMRIASLIDRRAGRQLVKDGQALNRIVCYENKPHAHDAWDINIYYSRRHWEVDQVTSARVIDAGPVLARVRVQYAYQSSTISQDVLIYRDLPRVDFETTADWREKQYLLKAHFPVDLFYNEATYDIQYGNIRRVTHKNTSWDVARFEVCAHKWADVSEDGYGVSLLNDCKYGHSIDEHSMALTLLKSSTYPDPDADQETHRFTYSILPHQGGWRDGGTVDMAYQLNVPVAVCGAAGEGALLPFAAVDAPGVLVETVKGAQKGEGAVVRVYECFGRRTAGVRLRLGFAPQS